MAFGGKRGASLVGLFHNQPIKRGELQTFINASGTIEPMEVVDVGAQVAGRIKSFGTDSQGKTVDFGSVVDKGAVLANWRVDSHAPDDAEWSSKLCLSAQHLSM